MVVGLLARLILYISLFFVVSSSVFSEDFSIFKKPVDREILKQAENAVKSFQKPSDSNQIQGIVEKHKETNKETFNSSNSKSENKLCDESKDKQIVYVLISFSMPKQSIKNLIRDAVMLNKEKKENIVLVLKGFVDGNLKSTIKEFYNIAGDRGFTEDIPLEINPNIFDEYNVKEAPVFIKGSGILKGDVGIRFALSKLREGHKNHGKYGNTYVVKEKDILEIVKQKQPEIERRLKEKIDDIRKNAYIVSRFDGKFQHAKEDRTYYINPSVVLSSDIKDHEGKVLFPKGSVFKPSDYVSLGRYIVIDGTSEKQVKFALNGDYKKIILIKGDIGKLIKTYKHRFYAANDEIVEKFKIQKVPAIIEQEGEYIRVTEKALN